MKAIICRGLPASGKSTWAKKFCKYNTDYVRISRDDLRNMRGEYWIPDDEHLITSWERSLIADAVEVGKNIVVDATNLNDIFLNKLKIFLFELDPINLEIEIKDFDVDVEECIRRDSLRTDGRVGETVIRNFYTKYLLK